MQPRSSTNRPRSPPPSDNGDRRHGNPFLGAQACVDGLVRRGPGIWDGVDRGADGRCVCGWNRSRPAYRDLLVTGQPEQQLGRVRQHPLPARPIGPMPGRPAEHSYPRRRVASSTSGGAGTAFRSPRNLALVEGTARPQCLAVPAAKIPEEMEFTACQTEVARGFSCSLSSVSSPSLQPSPSDRKRCFRPRPR